MKAPWEGIQAYHNPPTVPCKTCGVLTPMLETKLCNLCGTVERLLEDYLRRGGEKARTFVFDALRASKKDGPEPVEGAPV